MESDVMSASLAAALATEDVAPEAPIRLLYIVSLFPCWSETFIVREIQALLMAGLDVRILSLRHPSEALVQSDARAMLPRVEYPPRGWAGAVAALRELVRSPRVHARLLGEFVAALWAKPVALAKTVVAWWRTLALAPRVRELAPRAIHAHWATYPSTAALALARTLGIPFSFTSHAHDIFVEDHLIATKLREARFAVTISEFNRALLARRYGGEAVARLHVVRCGVSPEDLAWAPGGTRKKGLLLAIGRLDEIKGFGVLIEACAQLRDAGIDFRCEIVGEGPLRGVLERDIARLDLAQRVTLSGALPQEQVRRRLYEASVFVMPSVVAPDGNMDGVPVALMEAMAVGLPVVSTTVSGIPEIVRDGWSGRLAPPADRMALAEAIRALLEDADARKRFAVNARETVERGFNVAIEAGRLRGLLDQAIAGPFPAAAERRPA